MLKKQRLWVLCIVIFYHCVHTVYSEDDKTKREVWSKGSSSNFYAESSSPGNKNDKQFKSEKMSPFAQVFSAIDSLGLKLNGNVKTTVEFWPPDMDKDKFYKIRKEESAFPLTSWFNFNPFVKQTNEPVISYPSAFNDNINNDNDYGYAAESTSKKSSTSDFGLYSVKPPSIQIYEDNHDYQDYVQSTVRPFIATTARYNFSKSIHNPTVKYEDVQQEDNSFYSPTEASINYNDAMTYSGPIMFPTIEPVSEKRTRVYKYFNYVPTQIETSSIAPIPRANKKRKLKKKVKTSSVTQFAKESHIVPTPPPSIVAHNNNNNNNKDHSIDVIIETSSVHVPVNSLDNDSTQYMDIISNLSNLTEWSFSPAGQSESSEKPSKIYNSKIVNHITTTPYTFIINVEPETQDDVSNNREAFNHNIVTQKAIKSQKDENSSDKISLESDKSLPSITEVTARSSTVPDEGSKKLVESYENSSPDVTQNSMSMTTIQPSSTVIKNIHRSRFGIRKFSPNKASEAIRIKTSSFAPTSTTTVKSSTLKHDSKVKATKSPVVNAVSSEKPTIDMMNDSKSSTTRYFTPKSRSRHIKNNNNSKNSSNSSQRSSTKASSVKTTRATVAASARTKVRRTTKKPSN